MRAGKGGTGSFRELVEGESPDREVIAQQAEDAVAVGVAHAAPRLRRCAGADPGQPVRQNALPPCRQSLPFFPDPPEASRRRAAPAELAESA